MADKLYKVYIALGSNLQDREKLIKEALYQMKERGIEITAESSIYETKAYGVENQPDFLNMAVEGKTAQSPQELLSTLQEIEKDLGRVRITRWGPRTIDLDIIFYEDFIIDEEYLHIPHIDMHNRRFVLEPLCEIAPDLIHPIFKKSVSELLQELASR